MSAFRATAQGREGQGQPKAAPHGDVHQDDEAAPQGVRSARKTSAPSSEMPGRGSVSVALYALVSPQLEEMPSTAPVSLVSPLTRAGRPVPSADKRAGVALVAVRRRKVARHPELIRGGPQRLVVLAAEVGGRWSDECQQYWCSFRARSTLNGAHATCHGRGTRLHHWRETGSGAMTSRPSRGMQALRLAAKPFKKVADTVRRKRKTTLARFNGEGGTAIQECFLSVPPGAVAGEDFVAEISPDECAIVTLPHGVGPGDLLQVKVCYSGQDTHLEVLQHIQRPTLHNHNHRKLRTISSVAGCCAMLAVTIAILVPNWVAVSDGANQEHVGLLAIQREGFTQTWSYIAKQCQAACLEDLPPDQLQYHQQRCRRDFRLRSLAWSSFLGLLLAMSVQIWAVLSVTAMRFWHAVALGLLSMTLHGWAVAHFLLEVGRVFPSYTLRWSMWFDVAGFAFQLTALLLVLVLRMRAQQSSRLLGLDFHFLEDVMLLREAQV
eukprot:s1139_g24.t1